MVVFDDVTMLDVAGAGEVFAEAKPLRRGLSAHNRIGGWSRRNKLDRDAVGRHGRHLRQSSPPITVMVAGSDKLTPGGRLIPSLSRRSSQSRAGPGGWPRSAQGSFVLAQGRPPQRPARLPRHWHDVGLFARAFPDITVEPDAILRPATEMSSPRPGCRQASTWRWR